MRTVIGSGMVEKSLVVWGNLLVRNVEAELERHQDGELGGEQVAPVQSEHCLRFLYQLLQLLALAVIELGRQNQTCSRTEFSVIFVYYIFQHQLLKVDIRL